MDDDTPRLAHRDGSEVSEAHQRLFAYYYSEHRAEIDAAMDAAWQRELDELLYGFSAEKRVWRD